MNCLKSSGEGLILVNRLSPSPSSSSSTGSLPCEEVHTGAFSQYQPGYGREQTHPEMGKFGRFKYVYPREDAAEIKEYLTSLIEERFPHAKIEYFT